MACPLCRGEAAKTLYRLPEGFETRQCAACAFVFLWPRPTADYLQAYYSAAAVYDYDAGRAEDYANAINDKIALIGGFFRRFPHLLSTGRAVDFGAGQGATVSALTRLGFDAAGIEISEKARQAAGKLFGVPMQDGDLTHVAEDSLSLLSLFDVFEHLTDPKAFLALARSRLKTDAACVMVVPNFNSLDRMTRGTASSALIFPEHVNQFTRTSLRRVFEESGFRVLYVGSPPPYGVALSLGLRRGLTKWLGRNAVTRQMSQALSWIKRTIVYPLPNAFVERTGLFGHSLLIVAVKDESASLSESRSPS